MRRIPSTGLALACLVASSACSSGAANDAAITRRDSAGVFIVENALASLRAECRVDSLPAVSIGVAEGEPEYELHRVFGATRLSDGRIVLVNQGTQEIRYYDSEGKFLLRAGRAGQGPGEFSDAFYLWPLPGDTVYVGDYRPWQYLVFGPDGRWVRTVRPQPLYTNSPEVTSVLDDGRLLLAERPLGGLEPGFNPIRIALVVHDRDGALRDTIGRYLNGRWGRVGSSPGEPVLFPLFESFARITGRGSRILVSHSSRPEILLYQAGGSVRLEGVLRWTTDDRGITSVDVEAERQRYRDQYKDLEPAMRERVLAPLISERRPVADEFPAFARIQLGRDGRIWVREYRKPREPESQRWIAFDSLGRFSCRAAFPPRDEVLELGTDYVLVEHRDADGVEQVQRYTMGAPGVR